MARAYPSIDSVESAEVRHRDEWHTLLELAQSLPDEYSIYHGIHWARIHESVALYGEIDFIIANRYGRLVAIEHKAAELESDDGRLFAVYRRKGQTQRKDVQAQITRNLSALRSEFDRRFPGRHMDVDHILYIPRTRLAGVRPMGLAEGRVVDALETRSLAQVLIEMFDERMQPSGERLADPLEVHEFLSQKAKIAPEVGLIGEHASALTSRLSGGLAEWVGRLTMFPFRLRVQGTAGSGKTQLALETLRRAHLRGEQALYVCFNRALADAMRALVPDPSVVLTVHELGRRLLEAQGAPVDLAQADAFTRMEQALENHLDFIRGQCDVLIVDEGQDMEERWARALLQIPNENAQMLWLEDPLQTLYEREAVQLTGWPTMVSPVNYRSPARIVDALNAWGLSDHFIECGSGRAGEPIGVYPYEPGAEWEATQAAVADLLAEGYSADRIAVLSIKGASSSTLLTAAPATIAGCSVRMARGYDAQRFRTYTEGDLLLDTIFRFKGQCADAVVLTEVDREVMDKTFQRRLFVGLTRARLQLHLVAAEKSCDLLGL